jgi:hypothetical protein
MKSVYPRFFFKLMLTFEKLNTLIEGREECVRVIAWLRVLTSSTANTSHYFDDSKLLTFLENGQRENYLKNLKSRFKSDLYFSLDIEDDDTERAVLKEQMEVADIFQMISDYPLFHFDHVDYRSTRESILALKWNDENFKKKPQDHTMHHLLWLILIHPRWSGLILLIFVVLVVWFVGLTTLSIAGLCGTIASYFFKQNFDSIRPLYQLIVFGTIKFDFVKYFGNEDFFGFVLQKIREDNIYCADLIFATKGIDRNCLKGVQFGTMPSIKDYIIGGFYLVKVRLCRKQQSYADLEDDNTEQQSPIENSPSSIDVIKKYFVAHDGTIATYKTLVKLQEIALREHYDDEMLEWVDGISDGHNVFFMDGRECLDYSQIEFRGNLPSF